MLGSFLGIDIFSALVGMVLATVFSVIPQLVRKVGQFFEDAWGGIR